MYICSRSVVVGGGILRGHRGCVLVRRVCVFGSEFDSRFRAHRTRLERVFAEGGPEEFGRMFLQSMSVGRWHALVRLFLCVAWSTDCWL